MTNWQPGMTITAARLNDGIDATTETTGVTPASGWSLTSFSGKRTGKEVWINLVLQRTGAALTESPSGSGSMANTSCATLPAAWRPPESLNAQWGSTDNDGRTSITTDGNISLQTTSGSSGITTGDSIRITTSWVI